MTEQIVGRHRAGRVPAHAQFTVHAPARAESPRHAVSADWVARLGLPSEATVRRLRALARGGAS